MKNKLFVAGLFAVPEILDGWVKGQQIATMKEKTHVRQTWEGMKEVVSRERAPEYAFDHVAVEDCAGR